MENIILRDTVNEIVNYSEEKAIDVLGYAINDDKIVVNKYEIPKWVRFHTNGENSVYYNNIYGDTFYLEYSYDGINWTEWVDITVPLSFGGENGDLYLRGNNPDGLCDPYHEERYCFVFGNESDLIDVDGDATSLINENGTNTLPEYCFLRLFQGCTALRSVSSDFLPTITLSPNCYAYMFWGCTKLIHAPELPATTLANYCYQNMFDSCIALVTAPELPATTLVEDCYTYMFTHCISLDKVTSYATDISAEGCLEWWLNGTDAEGEGHVFYGPASMNPETGVEGQRYERGPSGVVENWTYVNID